MKLSPSLKEISNTVPQSYITDQWILIPEAIWNMGGSQSLKKDQERMEEMRLLVGTPLPSLH